MISVCSFIYYAKRVNSDRFAVDFGYLSWFIPSNGWYVLKRDKWGGTEEKKSRNKKLLESLVGFFSYDVKNK